MTPAFPHLAVALTFGPVQILAEEFAEVGGLELLEVFGSWAARHHGERWRPPADVLAVGTPDRDAVHEADPDLAYTALYDAIRKSCAALLLADGLRATSRGGPSHRAARGAAAAVTSTHRG